MCVGPSCRRRPFAIGLFASRVLSTHVRTGIWCVFGRHVSSRPEMPRLVVVASTLRAGIGPHAPDYRTMAVCGSDIHPVASFSSGVASQELVKIDMPFRPRFILCTVVMFILAHM